MICVYAHEMAERRKTRDGLQVAGVQMDEICV